LEINIYAVAKYVHVISQTLNLINNTFVSAFIHGDPNKLLSKLQPMNSQGLRCGLDAEVRDKPYLFFFDLTKCAAPNAIATGCHTPQVCLHLCFNW
jgi:hypothetical protein